MFPHPTHPYRLEFGEGKNATLCFFECSDHLQKYLTRAKLNPKDVKILYRDEKPTRTSNTLKNKVRQKSTKKSSGSASGNRRNTKDLDSSGTISGPRKSKPKK